MNKTDGKKITQWKQWTAAVIATLTMFCNGTVAGWTTTNMSRLSSQESPIILTSDQRSWLVSMTGVGIIIGPFIGAACADKIGRKKTLLLTSLFFVIGWLINIFLTTVQELYVAHIILGIGMGISRTASPLYVSEIADVNIRGALSTLMAVNTYSGTILACSVGPFVTIQTLSVVLLMIPILFVCLFIWCPETPHYLVSKEKYDEAAESLAFFKGISNQQEARKELEAVILNINGRSESQNWVNKIRDLLLPNNRKALGIVVALTFIQVMSGHHATTPYLQVLFQRAKIGMNAHLAILVFFIVGLFSSILVTMIIDRVGRRTLTMASSLGVCVNLVVLATYLSADTNDIDIIFANWLPVVAIILFQVTFHLGLEPVPHTLIGELFPANVKGICSALATILTSVVNSAVVKIYQIIEDTLGIYVVYYIFAGFCFLGFIFSLIFIPETMNKEFKEIQEELADSGPRCFKKSTKA